MINKLKNKLKIQDNRVLVSNFFSLTALKIATYLFPLITFPYLVRILGIELFGVLSMAMAAMTTFQIFTDYGFELTATKEISIHRDDPSKLSEIFSSVLTIQIILMFISFLVLSILVLSIQKFSEYSEVYFLTFGIIIGFVLSPTWFFQGMEKMKFITIQTIVSKLIFTLSIFLFVHDKTDYLFVPLLNSLGTIFAGILSLYIIHKKFEIKFTIQKLDVIKKYFQDGWDIFLQRMYVSLYGSVNILILGFLTNNTIVGYYAIATRIIDIIRQIFGIVSNVYFPYFTKKFINDPKKSFLNLQKVSKSMGIFGLFVMILILFFGNNIVSLIAGNNYNPRITESLSILSYGIVFLPFFSLFTSTLVAIGESKVLNTIARNTAIISILLAGPLIWLFEEKGLAYLTLFLQITILYSYLKVILKAHKSIQRKQVQ